MKLPSLLAVALLPFGLLAAPTAEAADLEIRQEAVARAAGAGLFERDRTCRLEGDAKSVNCRAGPGTKYKVVTTLGMWSEWVFDCVKSGECVNIGGKVNCGWHFIKYLGDHGCYINGHYTSDACTQASLGWC
ncbi:hypothetical protein VTK73DRAFT_6161 [Phialemonium thermophilum]|uniref:SH3 domain-containing protein n=1 Tax=Phialemonium thermophilum TaxID=223376 RepID=A0ABR3WKN5_9PEZI